MDKIKKKGGIAKASYEVLEPLEFYSSLKDDIEKAEDEIAILSPFVSAKEYGASKGTYGRIVGALGSATEQGVDVKLVVNEKTAEEKKDAELEDLEDLGIAIYKRGTHVKLVYIDEGEILYLGSVNPLSYWGKDEIMSRLESGRVGKIKKWNQETLQKAGRPIEEERLA